MAASIHAYYFICTSFTCVIISFYIDACDLKPLTTCVKFLQLTYMYTVLYKPEIIDTTSQTLIRLDHVTQVCIAS